jgi:cytochrome P450
MMTWQQLRTRILHKLPNYSLVYAVLRQIFSRYRLPPGKWVDLDKLERANRRFLLQHAAEVGSMFKARAWDDCWVCIVGIPRSRRLLKEHGMHLQPTTLQLESLFPKGFLRQMQAGEHQRYRKSLVHAMQSADIVNSTAVTAWEQITGTGLERYLGTQREAPDSPEPFIRILDNIATGMLVCMFYGVDPDSDAYRKLLQQYSRLGPFGLVWNVGGQQRQAFGDIRSLLLDMVAGQNQPGGIIGRLSQIGELDDTMLGNLIYMVEMGRYDLYSLFRWLSKYAASYPDLMRRIELEASKETAVEHSLVDAFVQETLRMDQSERLVRIAKRDIIFEGYLIPKYATVRLCLWEAHKLPDTFDDPFDFNPERFTSQSYAPDQYAPFGLDHHRCPFSDSVIAMSKAFTRVLASNYKVSPVADGLPVRGAYHWEPASRFSVDLTRKRAAGIEASHERIDE